MLATGANAQLVLKEILTSKMVVMVISPPSSIFIMIIDVGALSRHKEGGEASMIYRKGRDRVCDTLHYTSPVRGASEVFDLGWYIY